MHILYAIQPATNQGREIAPYDSHKKSFHHLTSSPVCRWKLKWKSAASELSIIATPQSRIPFRRQWWITMHFRHGGSCLINHWRWCLVEFMTGENMRYKGWVIASEEQLWNIMPKTNKKKKICFVQSMFTQWQLVSLLKESADSLTTDNHAFFSLFCWLLFLICSIKFQIKSKNTHISFLKPISSIEISTSRMKSK